MYTITRKLSILFVVISLFFSTNIYAQQKTTVTRVVDGDTLKLFYWGKDESIKLYLSNASSIKVEENIERLRNTNSCLGCELFYANLRGANLSSANLISANLFHAYLSGANLTNAYLMHSYLNSADLINTNLKGADLTYADMTNAYLSGANFEGANLKNVIDLTVDQLSEVKTLYKAILDHELIEQVKEKYPHLLKKPKEEESKPDE